MTTSLGGFNIHKYGPIIVKLGSCSHFSEKRSRAEAIISVHHPPTHPPGNFSKLIEGRKSLSVSSHS